MAMVVGLRKQRIYYALFFLAVSLFSFTTNAARLNGKKKAVAESCDIFKGSWVYDETYPMYKSSNCPFVRKEFDCKKYGRADEEYMKYRWQPKDCDIPRFNAEDFLKRFQGKKIMFIGDSLSLNFWQSLVCLLYSSSPQAKITQQFGDPIANITFQDYGVSIMLFHSLYLVDIEQSEVGRVMKLDSIKNGDIWKNMDVLIFNTYQWWGRRGPKQQWDYLEDDNKLYKDMNRTVAFSIGLSTWAKWVDSDVDPIKTKVYFQGISPSHYNGSDWNEPGVTNCAKETQPIEGSVYPGVINPATRIVSDVLSKIKKPAYLLDVTNLSLLRKDGHPASHNGMKGMDCTHWCIPGVPDTWSQLLYASLIESTT